MRMGLYGQGMEGRFNGGVCVMTSETVAFRYLNSKGRSIRRTIKALKTLQRNRGISLDTQRSVRRHLKAYIQERA